MDTEHMFSGVRDRKTPHIYYKTGKPSMQWLHLIWRYIYNFLYLDNLSFPQHVYKVFNDKSDK